VESGEFCSLQFCSWTLYSTDTTPVISKNARSAAKPRFSLWACLPKKKQNISLEISTPRTYKTSIVLGGFRVSLGESSNACPASLPNGSISCLSRSSRRLTLCAFLSRGWDTPPHLCGGEEVQNRLAASARRSQILNESFLLPVSFRTFTHTIFC
jgi:hypothetical protein